jgi:non-ribosomal peptide synthase protein (TIGR01720 family)
VADGCLQISFNYNALCFTEAEMVQLLEDYLEQLRQVIDHCTQDGLVEYTPSDFELVDVDQDFLDEMSDFLD